MKKIKMIIIAILAVATTLSLGGVNVVYGGDTSIDSNGNVIYNYNDNSSPKKVNSYVKDPIGWGGGIGNGDKEKTGVNCFDYYRFQSVQVNVGSDADKYNAGDEVKFIGNLVNENNQPIVNGNVFVRISRKNNEHPEDWDYIVDEFFALDNIVLKANERKPVEFVWHIPAGITKGEYNANFFFTVGKKFNLGGLSFSNEVIIGRDSFSVNSDNTNYVQFDRLQTKINGEKYLHVGSLPVIDKSQSPVLTQIIDNTFNKNKDIKITYDLYYWDGLNDDNKIDSKVDNINIPANSKKEIKYKFPKMDVSVYFLRVTAEFDNQKSIINIRLASNQERPRLNYPAIVSFPIKKGDKVTLYSCFHNTSSVNTQGKVVVTLTDEKGKRVAQINYKGEIPSAMSADKVEFVAKKNYQKLNLKAEVYDKNGKPVDSYQATYDCADFDACGSDNKDNRNNGSVINKVRDNSVKVWLSLLAGLFVIISVSTLVVVVIKNKNKSNN